MIYQIKLGELLTLLTSFLHSVDESTTLISRQNFEKFPGFSLPVVEFEKFLATTQLFFTLHPNYSLKTKENLLNNNNLLRSIQNVFCSDLNNTAKDIRKTYSIVKSAMNTISEIGLNDQNSFTLYKIAKNYPFDINTQYLNLFIDDSKQATLDLNGVSSLLQILDFPESFTDEIDKVHEKIVQVFCKNDLNEFKNIIPSFKQLTDTQKSITIFENTPLNLSDFLLDSSIKFPKDNFEKVSECFININDNNKNNQLRINESFKNDPIKTSVEGLMFIKENQKLRCKLTVVDDINCISDYDNEYLIIPIQKDIRVFNLAKKHFQNNDYELICLFLDHQTYYDEMILSSVFNMMLEQKTLFINTSLQEVINHTTFTNSLNPLELRRIQKNILFIADILTSESYIYHNFHKNTFVNIARLLLSLNFNINNSETLDMLLFVPLMGKDYFFNINNKNIYTDNYLYNKEDNTHPIQINNLLSLEFYRYITENFDSNFQAISNAYLTFESQSLFEQVLHQVLLEKFKDNHINIINKLIVNDNLYHNQLGIFLALKTKNYVWDFNTTSLNSYVEAFYNSNIRSSYINSHSNKFHKEITVETLFKNKNEIKQFELLLLNIIKYHSIYPEEKHLYNEVSNKFFIDLVINNDKKIDINLSSQKLLDILSYENKEELAIFINRMASNYSNMSTKDINFEDIEYLTSICPFISKALINNIVRMKNTKFQNQKSFDMFTSLSPTSIINIVNEFPEHLLLLPKNMKKILQLVIDNNINATNFYSKLCPDIYYKYIANNNNENINNLNSTIYNLLEQQTLTIGIVKNNSSKKTIKF